MKNLISEIKGHSVTLNTLNEEELYYKIEKIKKKIDSQNQSRISDIQEKILPEWFAIVQEISSRTIGLKHFNSQLLAGFYLNEGKVVEMKTGEGKTLASTLAISLNALTKKGVHVVTVNDYLAERDQKWMSKIYNSLGLSSGLVKSTSTISEKKKNYNCDITYVTNSELVFDFLRDSSASYGNEIVQRPLEYCIIDEIDSILIDEARTPLILSTRIEKTNINKLYLAKVISSLLEKELDFQLDDKRKEVNLTEKGYKKAKSLLGKESLYEPDDPWILEILNAIKAEWIFKLNKDYIVLNNKILIVDEFTGRIMEDRRWSLGIHEAVEIKENVALGGGTKTKSSITYQNFFTLYPKLAGMTGTAKTTEKEFKDIYNLDVVVIPTDKPLIRKDLDDLVYQNEFSKWKSVLKVAKQCFSSGQPLLIGTATVEKSEFLSDLFKISKIPHQVLNAKPENVARESEIIAQAGERYAITIATNMAGRGTDIILGGNPMFKVKQKISTLLIQISSNRIGERVTPEPLSSEWKNINPQKIEDFISKIWEEYSELDTLEALKDDISNLPYSLENSRQSLKNLYNYLYSLITPICEEERKAIKELGGLFVLGTERHETRRIDNQLRGRAGRQGDPGLSQFVVSLDDELLKIFGGENIKRWIDYLIQDKDSPLESNVLSSSISKAQEKVENYNYELRKNVFEYDNILNTQRKQLLKARKEILSSNLLNEFSLRFAENLWDNLTKKTDKTETISRIEKWFDSYFLSKHSSKKLEWSESLATEKEKFYQEIWITIDLRFSHLNNYHNSFLKNNRTNTLLSIIDFYWTEHLERMSYIRETINWRAYGQQNPLVEYNTEAFKSYSLMFQEIGPCMLYYLISNPIL